MVVVVVEKDYDSNDKIFHHYRIFDSIVSVVDNLLVVTNELKQKKKFKKNKKKLFHMMISTQQNGNKIHLEANGKKIVFFPQMKMKPSILNERIYLSINL